MAHQKNRKIIVTGGAGFIGSHLCEELSRDHQVLSVDDYSSGYFNNIASFNVEACKCDVTDFINLELLFSSFKPDVVFHQAASKKTVCLNNPSRDLDVNIRGTFNVATLCKKYNARLIHASTGSVYGEAISAQHENHPPNPVSYYGISKLAGEKYARFIADAVCLRYFHVYGPRQESDQDKGGVIAIWLDQIKRGIPVTLYGDGTQQRTFTWVKDVVKANILAMNEGKGIYNISSGHIYTLNDLISILRNIHGKFEVIQKDWQQGDIKKFFVDNTRARNLGVEFRSLLSGLSEMHNIVD